jgi:hypothetical protein
MAKAHGKNARVLISATGSGIATTITGLSKYDLDRSQDIVETTAFGDANKTYVPGLSDIKLSISGFWDSASDPLYTAGTSTDGVKAYAYPDFVNTPTVYDYGPAWLTGTKIGVDVNGAITISADLVANGSWGKKP